MLNVIDNALRDKNYYICLYDNYIYIYNYEVIISFGKNSITLKLSDKKVSINGTDLKIKKLMTKELLIEGDIKSVKYE
ncbi:MAG: YabP/YqfC family sporulation protein [bacterium]|nr:YabP/YqfC family sporulation protein [bacterium]